MATVDMVEMSAKSNQELFSGGDDDKESENRKFGNIQVQGDILRQESVNYSLPAICFVNKVLLKYYFPFTYYSTGCRLQLQR